MRETNFLPEGYGHMQRNTIPLSLVREQMERGEILEGRVLRCDERHALHIDYRGFRGVIPKEQSILPEISGADRDIALLSRVGRPVKFVITSISVDGGGKPLLMLSRRKAQQAALDWLLTHCTPGTVIPGIVTHLEHFGAFTDIGCGIIALLPLDRLSVSRVDHPRRRLKVGQPLRVMVTDVDREKSRFSLSTRELLGTWLENASRFSPGETVTGVIRSIKDYGAFVELAPNLSGLANLRPGIRENDRVSVYIKSIRPEHMKIKLQIVDILGEETEPAPLQYQLTDGVLSEWRYGVEGCRKQCTEWHATDAF